MAHWVATLAVLSACGQALGKMLLPPPRNVRLVSKDFNLFLTWRPGPGYTPGVFYTVQWKNVYNTWGDFWPCKNLTETVCNITCISPDMHNSFDVRVKAQGSAGTISSTWVNLENIDYEVDVTLAPPVLQVRKMGDRVVVNATFSDPSCLKAIFSDLTSELEFWEAGANNRKTFTMKNSKDFDATVFSGSDYCFSAQAVLNNVRSNFSEPTCVRLHSEADTRMLAAVPVLLLFILFVCIILSLYWSRNRLKTVRHPQALDFSSPKCPEKLLEFTKKEFISVLTCSGHPVVVENRSRLTPRMHSQLVPSVLQEYEEEEEEGEEDICSSRLYTELHQFQKNDMHSQMVGLSEKGLDGCSESDGFQLGKGSVLRIPGISVLTDSVFGEMSSRFQRSEMTLLSAGLSSEESSICPHSYPIALREGQEGLDEGTDFLFQLSDSNLPTGKLFMLSEGFHEASLGDPPISLFGVQSNQDFCGLLLEEENLSENDSCGCESPMAELSPLKMPSREGLECSKLDGNRDSIEDISPEPKSYGCQPRPVHYLPRILQR